MQRHPVSGNEANDGDDDDKSGAKPVDVLVPVLPGHGQLRDVRLLGVEATRLAEGLVVGRSIGKGRSHLRSGCRRGHTGAGSWRVREARCFQRLKDDQKRECKSGVVVGTSDVQEKGKNFGLELVDNFQDWIECGARVRKQGWGMGAEGGGIFNWDGFLLGAKPVGTCGKEVAR